MDDNDDFSHGFDDGDGYNFSMSMKLQPDLEYGDTSDGVRFLKEGFMFRSAPNGLRAASWANQYFRLTESALTYHDHPNAEAKGVALIVDITGVIIPSVYQPVATLPWF
jgi:hypothetical protein